MIDFILALTVFIYLFVGVIFAMVVKKMSDEDMAWWMVIIFIFGYPFLILDALRAMND